MEHLESMAIQERKNAFNSKTLNILLLVTPALNDIEAVKHFAMDKGLNLKKEFHCTLIGRATGEAIIEALEGLTEQEKENKIVEIENLYKKYDWNYMPAQEYYFISKDYSEDDTRESIVQIVEVPNVGYFYSELNKLLGTNFVTPLSHITLYTNSSKKDMGFRGIGIYSEAQFHSLGPVKIDTITL